MALVDESVRRRSFSEVQTVHRQHFVDGAATANSAALEIASNAEPGMPILLGTDFLVLEDLPAVG
jgi:hypothetical protein